jgi:ribosome-associated heat shock protein Hsp15
MLVRLDKWLQVARVFKTRSQATRACSLGRVQVNGQTTKPHRHVAIGDRVEINRGDWPRILEVTVLRDKPVKKAEAPALYQDLTPPRPPADPVNELMTRPGRRERGSGRPTKRDRRDLDRWRRS